MLFLISEQKQKCQFRKKRSQGKILATAEEEGKQPSPQQNS